MGMSVLKQGYTLLVISLMTVLIALYAGMALEILVLDGLLSLLVVIGGLDAILLALALIPALPFLIAKVALWPTKWPTYDEPSLRHGTATISTNDGHPTQALPLLHERWLLPLTVSRALVYVVMVTVILALGFLVFRHTRPGTIPDVQLYTTFGAEGVFFATLFAYVLIKHRRAASRSA